MKSSKKQQSIPTQIQKNLQSFLDDIEDLERYVKRLEPICKKLDKEDFRFWKMMCTGLARTYENGNINNLTKSQYSNLKNNSELTYDEYHKKELHRIYKYTLINICSLVEYFLLDLMKIFYRIPENKVLNNMEFKYHEIKDLEQNVQISEFLINKKINKHRYDSFSEWCVFFEKNIKIDIHSFKDVSHEIITEMFQRRNCFIHNKGRADDKYLAQCTKGKYKQIGFQAKKNDFLLITKQYLDNCIKHTEALCSIIAPSFWSKMKKKFKTCPTVKIEKIAIELSSKWIQRNDIPFSENWNKCVLEFYNSKFRTYTDVYLNYCYSIKTQKKLTKEATQKINSISKKYSNDNRLAIATSYLLDDFETLRKEFKVSGKTNIERSNVLYSIPFFYRLEGNYCKLIFDKYKRESKKLFG